jgi:hypothetical protein
MRFFLRISHNFESISDENKSDSLLILQHICFADNENVKEYMKYKLLY